MARSIWTGALSFGLVNVPVKLYPAVEERGIHFHQFQAGTGERIRNRRVAEGSGEEVSYEDIVKGYEVRDGEHVMLTPEDFETVEPERSRTIDLEDFVELDEIDPVHYESTYYAVPADEAAFKAFVLLHTAMQESNRAGIARFVMRGKQYLAAVRPGDDVLLVETMHFADEIRDPAAIDEARDLRRKKVQVSDRESRMAQQVIDSLTSDWDPSRYEDTYRQQLLDLIEAKARGEDVVVEEAPERAPVVDLMAALEESVRRAGERRRGGGGRQAAGGGKGGHGRGKAADEGDVGDRSREELYEEAQERGIAGRSKMSKEELAEALREAS